MALRVGLSGRVRVRRDRAGHREAPGALGGRATRRGGGRGPARPRPAGPRLRRAALAALLAGRSGNLKTVLTDQSVLAGRGQRLLRRGPPRRRAVAVQAGGEARRPRRSRTFTRAWSAVLERRRGALGGPAGRRVSRRRRSSGMAVHGRTGQACPVCGDTVREVSFATQSPPVLPDVPDRRQSSGRPPAVPPAQVTAASETEEPTHRGSGGGAESGGGISFYNTDSGRWVRWQPGVDAPPRPPGWGRPDGRCGRSWTSPWRILPAGRSTVVVVIVAVLAGRPPVGRPGQARRPRPPRPMLGKCLAQDGSALAAIPGTPPPPVACDSPKAAVKVVQVVPTTPGSPSLPAAGTTGVELPYPGVAVSPRRVSAAGALAVGVGVARPVRRSRLLRYRARCGRGSAGRAQPCQGWGRGFESRRPLQ